MSRCIIAVLAGVSLIDQLAASATADQDSDEMDRLAIAAEVDRLQQLEQHQPQQGRANFSDLSMDMKDFIADQVMPELAALKKALDAGERPSSADPGKDQDSAPPDFLDDDFVEVREQEHVSTGNHILLVLVLLMTCMLASHLVDKLIQHEPRAARYMRYLNSSTISVLVGWLFGVGMGFSSSATIRSTRKFSSELLYYMLLPPIIMEAGYSLRKRRFFSHIVEISAFAVLGTLVSAGTIAWILLKLMNVGFVNVLHGTTGMELIMFGSLISAVDPVSTLSVLSTSCNDDLLVSLIFGESVFNDAVVIVLTKQISIFLSAAAQTDAAAVAASESQSKQFNVNRHSGDDSNDGATGHDHLRAHHDAKTQKHGTEVEFGDLAPPAELKISEHILVNFVCVVIGSVLHGVLSALMFTKGVAMLGRSLSNLAQVLLVILHGLVIYILAEAFSLSGLMALFFYGIVVSHFNRYNMSAIARITLAQSLRVLASVSETYLYAYLGMTLTVMHDTHSWRLSFCTLIAIFVGRAAAIFPLSALLNLMNRHCRGKRGDTKHRHRVISFKHQVMLWVAGLRGALSFGLSLDFPGARHPFFVSTTIFIVLFTIVVLGSATEPLLQYLNFSSSSGNLVSDTSPDHSVNEDDDDTDCEGAQLLRGKVGTEHDPDTGRDDESETSTDEEETSGCCCNKSCARYFEMVWTEIHDHLVIRDIGQDGCAQLNDEQLCAVVEQELFPRVLAMAEAHRQGDAVDDDDGDDGGGTPDAKSPVHRSPSNSGVRAARNSLKSHADSPLNREPSPRQAK